MLKISVSNDYVILAVVISTNISRCSIHAIMNEGSHVPYIAVIGVTLGPQVHIARKFCAHYSFKETAIYLNVDNFAAFKIKGY